MAALAVISQRALQILAHRLAISTHCHIQQHKMRKRNGNVALVPGAYLAAKHEGEGSVATDELTLAHHRRKTL